MAGCGSRLAGSQRPEYPAIRVVHPQAGMKESSAPAADRPPRFGRMAEQQSRFDELMQLIRNGSDEAARELLDTYGEHILRIIRRRLHPRMRGQFDSIDFQQAVWASFFAMPAERKTFRTPEELALYLAGMADHKVAEAFRQAGTIKRSTMRQRSLEDIGEGNPCLVRKEDATPSQFAVAEECWDQMNAGKSPVLRQILTMLKERHSHEEIARRTGLHPKAIQRYLQRLKRDVGR